MAKLNYFVPIYGSYYHFITESALGLYRVLKDAAELDSRNCKLWYQGSFRQVVQMFSCYPVINIPIAKPYLKDASSLGVDIETLVHAGLGRQENFVQLVPMVQFLGDRIPLAKSTSGITIIRRAKKRVYLETDLLADALKVFQLPVRVVQLENESFANQVNVMRNTLILVAPHGAGTVNQMFMPKGGKIIELFPKGFENWHARGFAEVFGHELIEIESEAPGVFGRKPSPAIRESIENDGWPDRGKVRASRVSSEELHRVVRDVSTFSIDPEKIVEVVRHALA